MRSTQAHFYFLTQSCFFDFLSEKYDKEKMNFLNDFLCYDMLAANCQNRLVIVYIKIRTVRGRKLFMVEAVFVGLMVRAFLLIISLHDNAA